MTEKTMNYNEQEREKLFLKLKKETYAEEYDKYVYNRNAKIKCTEQHLDSVISEIISACEKGNIDPTRKTLIILPDRNRVPSMFATMEHNRAVARAHPDYIRLGDREYGPIVEEQVGSVKMVYPEWARRAVYRYHPNRKDVEVMHVETVRWKDGYQKVGKYDNTPKDQWINYPYPMCATSSERRGLKLAFWEILGDLRDDEEREFYDQKESKDDQENLENKKQEIFLDRLIEHLSGVESEQKATQIIHYFEKSKEKIEKARKIFPEKSEIIKKLMISKIDVFINQKKNAG